MPISLRDYQSDILQATRRHFQKGVRRVLIVSPTGSGKSRMGAALIEGALAKGKRVWWITHRRELLKQSALAFIDLGLPATICGAGFASDPGSPLQVCSIQSLTSRQEKMAAPDILIFDECFPAGTLVDNGIPIESIHPGDSVTSFDTKRGVFANRQVIRVITKLAPETLIEFSAGGTKVLCTPNHKIWTTDGWARADSLTCDSMVLCTTGELYHGTDNQKGSPLLLREMLSPEGTEPGATLQAVRQSREAEECRSPLGGDLQRVQVDVYSHRETGGRVQSAGSGLLLEAVLRKTSSADLQFYNGTHKQEVRFGSHEGEEPHEIRNCQREDEDNLTGNGMEAASKGRQWNRTDSPAITVGVRSGMGDGSSHPNWHGPRIQVSGMLQGGYRKSNTEDRDRSGRRESSIDPQESSRQKEGRIPYFARVERIEVHQSNGDRTFGGLCPGGFVYNLEVEDFHTYTANGIVVSNCHHIAAASWKSIAQRYSTAAHLGLTATPTRLDGAGLCDFFDAMVQGLSVATLIGQGWLSPYRLFAPARPDLSAVHTVAGDYNKKELSAAMNTASVSGDVVKHYLKHAAGQRAIAFMWSVDASIDIAARFNAAGIPAAHIDGTTDEGTRDRAVQLFRDGSIQVLSNCEIVGEGFDIPLCSAGLFVRPTQSLTIWLQQLGRVMRPGENKIATLMDFTGNSRRLGLPDDDRQWSLEGEPHKRTRRDDDALRCRTCPKCDRTYGLQVRVCECGYLLVSAREMDVDENAELAEVDAAEIRRIRMQEQGRQGDLAALTAYGRKKGMKFPDLWAKHVLRAREEKKAAKARQTPLPIPQEAEDRWMF